MVTQRGDMWQTSGRSARFAHQIVHRAFLRTFWQTVAGTPTVAGLRSVALTASDLIAIDWAGVALGIASIIATKFPAFGAGFRDVAIACVALNEMVGPVLFKLVLDRAKESQAPTASLDDEEAPAQSV